MTALERAARAAWMLTSPDLHGAGAEAVWKNQGDEEKLMFVALARAVLMAVRDLPTEFISKQRGQLYRTEFLDCDFTTMIDAILNEKYTAND